jgi:Na+/H+ antiporter NhaD/arsenite permease-like protein
MSKLFEWAVSMKFGMFLSIMALTVFVVMAAALFLIEFLYKRRLRKQTDTKDPVEKFDSKT